jgi:tetratricopeptide (TPR) repeat protein
MRPRRAKSYGSACLALAALLLALGCATLAPMDLESRWQYDKPAESEQLFRSLLANDATLNADQRLEVRTQIARALGLQQRFAQAQEELDAVERAGSRSDVVAARLQLERGRVLRSSGDAAASRPAFVRALAAAERARHEFLAADALHMLAIVAPPEQAVAAHVAAIARVERSNDARVRRWLAPLHNNLGWAYHDRGEYAAALDAFQKAVPLYEARGNPADVLFARWTVARALRSLGRCDEALSAQRELLAAHAAAGSEDGYVHEEIAECLLALGRGDEARPHFREAHRLLAQDAWLTRDEPARLARLKELGGE